MCPSALVPGRKGHIMKNQHNGENSGDTKTYYLPGHPEAPVSHEFFVEFMRPYRRKRKQLEREGLCNPAYGFVCTCDCVGCRYAVTERLISTNTLEENGIEIDSGYRIEEEVAKESIKNSLRDMVKKLDLLDKLIIYTKIYHVPAMTDRQAAEYISVKIGRPYSHQAVSKRLQKVMERLYRLASQESGEQGIALRG